MKLISKSLCHLVGSDAHDDTSRNFCLKDALVALKKKYNDDDISFLKENSSLLVQGKDLPQINFKKKNKFWFF